MRRFFLVIFVVAASLLYTSGINMAEGEGAALYESMKCGMCHKPDKKAAAVSLADIARAYQEKGKLVKFLNGESKPLIESEKWGMMKGQMSKIAPLQEQEKNELADYILSFK